MSKPGTSAVSEAGGGSEAGAKSFVGTSSLRRATAAMAVSTVLSRATGFGRTFALAYAIGFSRLTDTYNLANNAPNIVYELVLGGILSATLVPVFVERLASEGVDQQSEEEAWRGISAVVTLSAVALVALTAAFALAAPGIIRLYTLRLQGSLAQDQQATATALLWMFAPQVLFYGLIALATALLNARRRFVAPAATPVLNNIVVIVVLLALPHLTRETTLSAIRHDVRALLLLGVGTTAGVAVQAVSLVPSLRRARLQLRLVWEPTHELVRTVLRLSGWTFGYVVTNQLALWVVLVLANGGAGDLSAYNAAYLFFILPHSIFAVSLMTALLPDLSQRWAEGDLAAFRRQLSFGLRVTALVMLPAAAGYIVLAEPIVAVVLRHGALSAGSARTTAQVLALSSIGLPAFSAYLLLMRAYQAMLNAKTMFYIYLFENSLNVAAAFALYPFFGVQGLAMALALAYLGGTALALWDLRRRIGGIEGRVLLRSMVRIAGATLAMCLGLVLSLWAAVSHLGAAGQGWSALIRVGVSMGVGVSLFLVAARAFGVTELAALFRMRRSPT